MSAEALPHWRDTVALLKTKGFTDEQITDGVAQARAVLGGRGRTEDFVLWVTATQVFKVEMPRISTLERKARGDAKSIVAKDVTREMGEEYKDSNQDFTIEGWVLNPVEFLKKGGSDPRLKVTLVDLSGSTPIICFGSAAVETWQNHELDYPSYVRLEGVQVFPLGEDGVTLTHGKYAKCTRVEQPPYPLEKALPDAAEAYTGDGKVARLSGFVTDEDRRTWEKCSKCGKGKKKCGGHQGGSTFEPEETHTLTVFDGASRHTLVLFGDLAPRRDVYGHPVEAVAIFRKKDKGPGEFEALSVSIGSEAAFKPLKETMKPSVEPAPKLKPANPEAVVGKHEAGQLFPSLVKSGEVAIWPQTLDLLNKNLRPHRIRSKQDIVTAFYEDKMHERDIGVQLARACAQGLIREAGESYQWLGGEPVIAEPNAEASSEAATAPATPARPIPDPGFYAAPDPAPTPKKGVPPPATPEERDQRTRQRKIMALVKKLDDGKGAPWEDVVRVAAEENISEAQVEETFNELFDNGTLYEPVLGRLKPT